MPCVSDVHKVSHGVNRSDTLTNTTVKHPHPVHSDVERPTLLPPSLTASPPKGETARIVRYQATASPRDNLAFGDYASVKILGRVLQRGLPLHSTALRVNSPSHLVEKAPAFPHIFFGLQGTADAPSSQLSPFPGTALLSHHAPERDCNKPTPDE